VSDVVVVGLGADGSAAAMHLARRGEQVLGLEAFARGHTLGSSGGLTRVIRLAYYEHPDYVPLLRRAWTLWRELESVTGLELLRQTGGLYAGPRGGALIAGSLRSAREHGLEHELLDPAALRARMPLFRFDPEWWGLFEDTAGFLFPERAIAAQQREAERHGAALRFDSPVTAIRVEAEGIAVDTVGGTVRADRVVVTAGAWNAGLLPALAPLLQVRRVPLFWFEPAAEHDALARLPVYIVDSGQAHGCYGFPYLPDQGLKGRDPRRRHTLRSRHRRSSDDRCRRRPGRAIPGRAFPCGPGCATVDEGVHVHGHPGRAFRHRRRRAGRLRLGLQRARLQVRERDR